MHDVRNLVRGSTSNRWLDGKKMDECKQPTVCHNKLLERGKRQEERRQL